MPSCCRGWWAGRTDRQTRGAQHCLVQIPDPTFADCLAAVRWVLWAEETVSPILCRDDYPTWRARARRRTLADYEMMALVKKRRRIDGYDMQAQAAFVAALFDVAA